MARVRTGNVDYSTFPWYSLLFPHINPTTTAPIPVLPTLTRVPATTTTASLLITPSSATTIPVATQASIPATSPTTSATRLNDEATLNTDNSNTSTSTPTQTLASSQSTLRIPPTTEASTSGTPGASGFTTKPSLAGTYQDTDVGPTPTVSLAPTSSTHTSNAGAVVGGIIGGLIFLIFLVVIVVIYLRRRRRKRTAPSAEFMAFFRRHGSLLSTYRFKRNSQRSSVFNSLASEVGEEDSPTSEKGYCESNFESDRISEQTRITYGLAV